MAPPKAPPEPCASCKEPIGPAKEEGKEHLDFLPCVFCPMLTHSGQSCSGVSKTNLAVFRFGYCRFACYGCRGLSTPSLPHSSLPTTISGPASVDASSQTDHAPPESKQASEVMGRDCQNQAGEAALDLSTLTRTVAKLSEQVGALTASQTKCAPCRPDGLAPVSYAAAAKGAPPASLATAIADALRDKEGKEKRLRCAVIDGLTPDPTRADLPLIKDLLELLALPSPVRIVSCQRMGQQPDSARPPKVKIELESPVQLTTLGSSSVRRFLRSDECPAPFNVIYINPSRTYEERRLFASLRARCKELNGNASSSVSWFVCYRRGRLVKREEGEPVWNGEGDPDWVEWSTAWEAANPSRPRRPSAGLSSSTQRHSTVPHSAFPIPSPSPAAPPPGTGTEARPSLPSLPCSLTEPNKPSGSGNAL